MLVIVPFASDWLLATSAPYPGHLSSAVPPAKSADTKLIEKITNELTNSLAVSTGVPSHVKQLNLMTLPLELCQTTSLCMNEQSTIARESIF